MSHSPTGLQLLVLPASGADLVLPAGAVAEIVRAQDLKPPPQGVPDWVLGILPWRGHEVLVARLADCSELEGRPQAVVVCFAPSGDRVLPYLAIASPGLPQLARVTPDDLASETDVGQGVPWFVAISLRIKGSHAWLPHFAALEKALRVEVA